MNGPTTNKDKDKVVETEEEEEETSVEDGGGLDGEKKAKAPSPRPPLNGERFVLAVDVGTTGIRSFLFNKEAKRLGCCYQRVATLSPEQGYAEQDPIQLWKQCKAVMRQVLKDSAIPVSHVVSIGLTAQRGSFLVWHRKTGKPLSNFILWQDVRSVDICNRWNSSLTIRSINIVSKYMHMVTRGPRWMMASIFKLSPMHVTPRLLWVLENVAEAKEALDENNLLFGTVDTWLLWKLTGGKVFATDYSSASSTGIYDPFRLQWNQQVLDIVGIPACIFPEVLPTSGSFGATTPNVLGAPVPITAIVADQQAALFAECCFDAGDLKVTIGTGGFMDVNTGSALLPSKNGLFPLIAWKLGDKITYMTEGPMSTVGSVLDWGKEELNLYDDVARTSEMAESVPDTDNVYFVPAFSGLNSPYQDPTARGTILGLTMSTKKEHIVRALLESFSYCCQDLLLAIREDFPSLSLATAPTTRNGEDDVAARQRLPLIKLSGGVAQNDFLLQSIADTTNAIVERAVSPQDTTALGAAYLAGLAVGLWASTEELKRYRKVERVFQPKPTQRTNSAKQREGREKKEETEEERRAAKYAKWKKAVSHSLAWADTFATFDAKPLSSSSSSPTSSSKREKEKRSQEWTSRYWSG
ncbi:putative glycerol kinase 5 [Balamuthia mandrillaris]